MRRRGTAAAAGDIDEAALRKVEHVLGGVLRQLIVAGRRQRIGQAGVRISTDESERAAVMAKPASPRALRPGAAIWPEISIPSGFSVGKVTFRMNQG